MPALFDLDATEMKLKEAAGDISEWSEREYTSKFSTYFEGVLDVYDSMKADGNRMSDEQLEWILTSVPMQMMLVSEELSRYKLNDECLKLYTKKLEREYADSSECKTVSARKDDAADQVIEYKMLHSAYSSVISRVESEIAFARELIMSAKKIWDARVRTYEANPVVQDDKELKDYTPKTYIG